MKEQQAEDFRIAKQSFAEDKARWERTKRAQQAQFKEMAAKPAPAAPQQIVVKLDDTMFGGGLGMDGILEEEQKEYLKVNKNSF